MQTIKDINLVKKYAEELDGLSEKIVGQLHQLSEKEYEEFVELYTSEKKDLFTAYICLIFGMHYLYLEKFWFTFFYIITGGGVGTFTIISCIRMPYMVNKCNNKAAKRILKKSLLIELT